MASRHHHREALLKSHHGALAHQQMADASWSIRTRGRAGEARASGLGARTFTHRRRKSGTEVGRLKINSDEFIDKLINTTIKAKQSNLKRLGLPVEVVRKVTETPAVCRRGKKRLTLFFKIPNCLIFLLSLLILFIYFFILYGNFKGSFVRKAVYFLNNCMLIYVEKMYPRY